MVAGVRLKKSWGERSEKPWGSYGGIWNKKCINKENGTHSDKSRAAKIEIQTNFQTEKFLLLGNLKLGKTKQNNQTHGTKIKFDDFDDRIYEDWMKDT